MNSETIKQAIKKNYGDIATTNLPVGCCAPGSGCCTIDGVSATMSEDYTTVGGYEKGADLALGCGLPTELANIHLGDTVIDLGSGAGNDAFIARSIVGENGKVIGIDFTPKMVIRALQNTQKLGYHNVEFVLGDIENMKEVASNLADVVISNCVMNLVPNKGKAFNEVNRVLKVGGHFCIADIVFQGMMPQGLLEAAEMYSGCIAGASERGQYLGVIKNAGFKNIQIKIERKIELPDELLAKYLNPQELLVYTTSASGIYSVTIYADKLEEGPCCASTGTACCGSDLATEGSSPEKSTCCGTQSDLKGSGCC